MLTLINDNDKFDYKLETSDWRYSAAIVGLLKYFDFLDRRAIANAEDLYKKPKDEDYILYNSDMIKENYYMLFVEEYFQNLMHHKVIESILLADEITDQQKVILRDKLKANSIMKKFFSKIEYSEENKEKILNVIEKNREELIKETYRRATAGYTNFNNPGLLMTRKNKVCRVNNYNMDISRKSKSLSFKRDLDTYVFEDNIIFDFIPFAFSKSYEAFFINNNFSVNELLKTNSLIELSDNPRNTLFSEMKNSEEYIDFDVEVITKSRDEEYYKTLYIRKNAAKVFKNINNFEGLQFSYKKDKSDTKPRYMEKEIINCILNGIKLDGIIELLMKNTNFNYSYNIKTLIQVNNLIYGGDKMNAKMKSAFAAAKEVRKVLDENKVNSYKQKLISAITFKDYDRFCEVLIQLTAYSKVNFSFAYDLFDNFDENKNLAYTFINALNKDYEKKVTKMEGNKNEK